jgi:hypothetical protein
MPKFTLIKHPDNQFDAEVTVTFESDMLGVARGHFDDFLQASGFEVPLEAEATEEPDFEFRLTQSDRLVTEQDWAWNDAFAAKFSSHSADIITFPTKDDDDFSPDLFV